MVVPPVVVLAVGAIGAAIVANLIVREWQRIQSERAKPVPIPKTQRDAIPRLRRDPVTGVYRP